MKAYTKDRIKEMIHQSSFQGKEIVFEFNQLVPAFGFQRMRGEEILLRQLITNKTEEQLQTLPMFEIMHNIETWCGAEGIRYHYDLIHNQYIFFQPINKLKTFFDNL